MANRQPSIKPPKVLLNDCVCVVEPPTPMSPIVDKKPDYPQSSLTLTAGGGGGSSSSGCADVLSVCSIGAITVNSLSPIPILTRGGALRMKFQKSLSHEFFSISITDTHSVGELRFEPVEHPPSIESLRDATRRRFSSKWLKYMYAKFKNECPTGRMRVYEFKRLMGAYVPDRISDAYLERMFYALCSNSPSGYSDQLTFRDLMVSLAVLFEGDPRQNAEWTMRLIVANSKSAGMASASTQITVEEFSDFVKSVFLLVGRKLSASKQLSNSDSGIGDASAGNMQANQPPCSLSRNSNCSSCSVSKSQKQLQPLVSNTTMSPTVFAVKKATLTAIRKRAITIFKELDVENRGYLTVDNFEHLFRMREIPTQ